MDFVFLFFGLIIGFLISFFVLKYQIQKDGAGNLRTCLSCPYKIKSSELGEFDDRD